ncbi:oxysterol-binding protein-related protein 9/10/11 [Geosmithia morbida]|uniref:Oxysterol-binding protein-related protein 9/10/11 n=1 Tax=Geosmithia morbida TaxID=1094350 RepID=A0A9P5D7T3_9HYPO|nr:oxysterol-binding protein-related protein 9/10/11 [Geosmithia morbida]KAF4126065.1 oxysterol-binding protein-related protein 9/10/11 [Geosmithia morbida]
MASSVPPTAEIETAATTDEHQSDGSKLKTFLGILRKFIGVADLASVRFSLPSQLLEPTPNLEYWNYIDAPNAFVAIGTSDDELDRTLEVLRFWLTKDLKYIKGKPCKPYNSVLGEFFRCNWETEDNAPLVKTANVASKASSTKSGFSGLRSGNKSDKNDSSLSLSVPQHGTPSSEAKTVRISYLTEQTSHHPPVSAFYVSCPEKGISARGFDQITAKFTGTSVKVMPGEHNMGIFITLDNRGGEEYQLTHPAAYLGGLLRGSLSVSASEMAYVTCPATKIKVILHYYDEGWLGRYTNKVDGVIFRYNPDNDDKTRIQDVPDDAVLARISGAWREKVMFSLGTRPFKSVPAEEQHVLIDIGPLSVAPKLVPPKEKQAPNESLTFWGGVTDAIKSKQFSKATSIKIELEEAQRELARKREAEKTPFKPVFFEHITGNGGRPDLTEKGKKVLERAQQGDWNLEGIV